MDSLKPISLFLVAIAAIIPLLAATGISQTVEPKAKATGSISGHVYVGGKGAAGIAVGAFANESTNRRIATAQVATDSEGYYLLSGLAAGNYQITTFTTNLTLADPNSDNQFGYPFVASKSVLLSPGEEVKDLDIKLVRGGVITGRVTDADNKPLVEERVNLQPIQENGRFIRPPNSLNQTNVTDDRGVYRIYGLPAGRYRVSVGIDPSGGGFSGGLNGYYQLTYHPDVTDESRATIIELAEGSEAKNVDIRVGDYHDTYTIGGRVVDSETGLPISGLRLGLMVTRGQQTTPWGTLQSLTSLDGKFNQQGFSPGHYGVYVASEYGNTDSYSDPVFFDVIDKNVSGLEIRAVHGLSISGTLIAQNMQLKDLLKELPGLQVSAMVGPADGRMTASTIRSFGRGVVAPDGSFQISGLRPGRASLSVSLPTSSAKRASILSISHDGIGISQGFEIQPGQSVSAVQIVVEYGTGAIRGSVAFEGGTPPAGLRTEVICYRTSTSRSFAGGATVDARGHFLITGFAPGTYECNLQHINVPGVAPRIPRTPMQTVSVANDAEAELNFIVNLAVTEGKP